MRSNRTSHGFVALRLEGGILPAEFFQKVAALEAKKQKISDYRLAKGLNIRDEIGRAWRIAIAEWHDYQEHRIRSNADQYEIGVNRWLVALFKQVLGFEDLRTSEHILLAERSFPINYHGENNVVPIVLTTSDYLLDKSNSLFGEEGRKRSPHGLLQEYLNADETCLWGIVSNGLKIRLLRDNPSLTRPAYIEADLQRIFDEELFADFAAFWLIFHASRFRSSDGVSEHCALEEWRAEAHEVGERALADLQKCVKNALRELGNGFVQYQSNTILRAALQNGSFSPMEYYQELLKQIYRFIFLFTAEDRNILHIPGDNEEGKKLYHEGYSIARLREMALKRHNYDVYSDLWEGLQITFKGLAQGADPLRLPALGGLFTTEQCPWLDGALINNNRLLNAIYSLSFFRTGEVLARINYHDMDTEELGSVYESLLELHPQVNVEALPWTFSFAGEDTGEAVSGSERKLSGSYYTPDSLVQELIKSALEPVIARTLAENTQDPASALLKLKIIDPACGSGHFLLAAARRLAAELARLDADTNQQDEDLYRHSMRMVVQKCIHGVDLNPMAVELCKTALWLETIEPGMPLGFLDNHIRCGNSLVGVRDPKIMEDGIPDAAFKALSGDDPDIAKELKKVNKQAGKSVHGDLFSGDTLAFETSSFAIIDDMPEDSLSDIKAKKEAFLKAQQDTVARRMADLFTAAFFAPKTMSNRDAVPLTEDLNRARKAMVPRERVSGTAHELANKYHFFHWYLEFPQVFTHGGFDVVLGNPPWEVSQLSEEEYFSVYSPDIAILAGARRKAAIKRLVQDNPPLWQRYLKDKYDYETTNNFIRESGLFPLTAFGKLNTYSLFSELSLKIVSSKGYSGIIVQSGIAFDDSNKAYFDEIVSNKRLVSLFDFENREKIFKAVDSRMKFALLTLGTNIEQAVFCFFATNTGQITEPRRRFTLSADDIHLLNPNTRTCPTFRNQATAELTKKVYRCVPVLIDESKGNEGNLWGITLRQGLFNMTSDSHLFKTFDMLSSDGDEMKGVNWCDLSDKIYLPLYEAKMIHQFDHRWATYEENGKDSRDVTDFEKQNSAYEPLPRYWVVNKDVDEILNEQTWLMGFRDVTNATNERTIIASVINRVGVGHKMPLIFSKQVSNLSACLLANLNSFILDSIARQKIGGTSMSHFIFKQLPVLSPSFYAQSEIRYIIPRILELVYTSESLRPFAEDLGYTGEPFVWNPERRALIRAELDAAFFHLYLGSEQEWKESGTKELLEYFPMPRSAVDFIMETFPIVKRKDEQKYGRYYTKEAILEIYDNMSQIIAENAVAVATGRQLTSHYQTRLNPPPGPPTDAAGNIISMYHWSLDNWPEHVHPPSTKWEKSLFSAWFGICQKQWKILDDKQVFPWDGRESFVYALIPYLVQNESGKMFEFYRDAALLASRPERCEVLLLQDDLRTEYRQLIDKAGDWLKFQNAHKIRPRQIREALLKKNLVRIDSNTGFTTLQDESLLPPLPLELKSMLNFILKAADNLEKLQRQALSKAEAARIGVTQTEIAADLQALIVA
jgi:hypothetical protein